MATIRSWCEAASPHCFVCCGPAVKGDNTGAYRQNTTLELKAIQEHTGRKGNTDNTGAYRQNTDVSIIQAEHNIADDNTGAYRQNTTLLSTIRT